MRSHGGDAAGGTVRLIVARPRRRFGNVPAEATSFVGRRRELAEVLKALVGVRLVSLVGPVSERTVATHVRNILNKLGFDSRAQIASWMASSDS